MGAVAVTPARGSTVRCCAVALLAVAGLLAGCTSGGAEDDTDERRTTYVTHVEEGSGRPFLSAVVQLGSDPEDFVAGTLRTFVITSVAGDPCLRGDEAGKDEHLGIIWPEGTSSPSRDTMTTPDGRTYRVGQRVQATVLDATAAEVAATLEGDESPCTADDFVVIVTRPTHTSPTS